MNLWTSGKNDEKRFWVGFGKRYLDKENGINFINDAEIRHLSACSSNSTLKFGLRSSSLI
jgi:hypothetical protein